MTREEVKELLPVMQAFAEGKTIEYSNQDKQWFKTNYPIWENNCKYRIKPEPKYNPFDTKEECWNEMLKHQPFGYLTDKEEDITARKSTGTVTYTATEQQDTIIRAIIFTVPIVIVLAGIIVWQVRRRKK